MCRLVSRAARAGAVLAVASAAAGCQPKAAPLVLSLPAPTGAGRVDVALPQLAVLAPPSTADLCADAGAPLPPTTPYEARQTWDARRAAACATRPPEGSDAFLDLANTGSDTRDGRMAVIAAVLASLRRAQTADDVRLALNYLGVRLREDGTALGEPQFYAASAEVFERRAAYCPPADPDCRRNIFLKAGQAFVEAGRWRGDTEALREAIRFLDRARAATEPGDTDRMTAVLNALGNAYAYESELWTGERARDDLAAAATAYEDALPALDKGPHDFDWAMIHHNLGTVYDRWNRIGAPGPERDAHLDRAIAEVERALTVWTRDGQPSPWADANDNLGASIFRRGEQRGQPQDLDRGLDILRGALAVRTARKADDPLPWAYSTLALAAHLLDRADRTSAGTPDAAARDRAEARRLLDACEPTLRAAKAAHYLAKWESQRARLAATAPAGDLAATPARD